MLNVIYRATPIRNVHKNLVITPKPKQTEKCFKSLVDSLCQSNAPYSIKILLDKPTDAFEQIFEGHDVELSNHPDWGTGNVQSFHRQLDVAAKSEGLYFLFVEDDYLFLPDAIARIYAALEAGLEFVSPYDHPDYYNPELKINEFKREGRIIDGKHWFTIESTTLTFGGHTETLRELVSLMKRYGWADAPMWEEITKTRKLWTPVPSLATHMEPEHMSKAVEWHDYL